jgi:hypothetical protein
MILHPLSIPLGIPRQMRGIKRWAKAADNMTIDDAGAHRQQAVADRETPDGTALDMGQAPEQEGRQAIHQRSSFMAGWTETTSVGLP